MELTYYTIDDLALPAKGVIRKRQSIAHFDTLAEALRHFQSLGPSMHKSLGLTDGAHTLELVRRVSFFEDDREGEDILAADLPSDPVWSQVPEAEPAVRTCVETLHLRYMLCPDAVMPIPTSDQLPKNHRDKYLWLDQGRKRNSAIRWVYIAGTGWTSLKEWASHADTHPLVLRYRVDGMTENGAYHPMDILPWEYPLLLRRTLARLCQNTGGARL